MRVPRVGGQAAEQRAERFSATVTGGTTTIPLPEQHTEGAGVQTPEAAGAAAEMPTAKTLLKEGCPHLPSPAPGFQKATCTSSG